MSEGGGLGSGGAAKAKAKSSDRLLACIPGRHCRTLQDRVRFFGRPDVIQKHALNVTEYLKNYVACLDRINIISQADLDA